MAADEIIDYLENGNIRNSVNYPNLSLNAVGTKICIIHKNVPTTLASITTAVGNEGINIENMANASKGDFAYTMLDVTGEVPASVEGKINTGDGVIRVRVIG
jgi:D-3-phosphoglycerate dehydrogenase